MLVLSRNVNQTLMIGDNVIITVLGVKGKQGFIIHGKIELKSN